MSRFETRRHFFRSFIGELAGFVDEVRGTPQYRLGDLAKLPEEALLEIRPTMIEGCRIVDRRIVEAKRDQLVPICALDEVGEWMAARWDGRTSNAEIARCAALELGLEPESARQRVRSLFLALARKGVCVPADAPEGDRREQIDATGKSGSADAVSLRGAGR